MALTRSGKPVVAYVTSEETTGQDDRRSLRVARLSRHQWLPVGPALADVTSSIVQVDLTVDPAGRPIVAWSEENGERGANSVFVRRFSGPLE